MIDMVYLYSRFDQIGATGAWGKSLVALFYPLKGTKPGIETKEEGGMTTTAMTLNGLKEFWLCDDKFFTMPFVSQGKNYFLTRYDKGFGTLSETGRDGKRFVKSSSRHTAMSVLALIGLNGNSEKILGGLNYITENLEEEISSNKETCPAVAIGAAIAAFEYFALSKSLHAGLQSDVYKNLNKFINHWDDHKARWSNMLCQIKIEVDSLWPPYAGLKEFSFYPSLIIYGLIPGIIKGNQKDRFFDFIDLVCSKEVDGGVPFSHEIKNADFGTTAKVYSILKIPVIVKLFEDNGKKNFYEDKLLQYEKYLINNYANINSEAFRMIFTETVSSLLPHGTFYNRNSQIQRIVRLEKVISQVKIQYSDKEHDIVINMEDDVESRYPYLRQLITNRIFKPYLEC